MRQQVGQSFQVLMQFDGRQSYAKGIDQSILLIRDIHIYMAQPVYVD